MKILVVWEILAKISVGSKWTPLNVYVDQKSISRVKPEQGLKGASRTSLTNVFHMLSSHLHVVIRQVTVIDSSIVNDVFPIEGNYY